MKYPTVSEPVKHYMMATGGSGLVTFIVLRICRKWFQKWRESLGVPEQEAVPHHSHLGIPIILGGIIAHSTPASPYMLGAGIAMIAEDFADLPLMPKSEAARQKLIRETVALPFKGIQPMGQMPYDTWDVHTDKVDLNPFFRQKSYNNLVKKLAVYVNKKTYNRTLGEWIEPGYQHPSVVWTVRNLVGVTGADGYEPVSVLRAIHSWIQVNKSYVLDPISGVGDEDEDWYFHPRIMLDAIHNKQRMAGDCDDLSILGASMVKAAGIPAGFILYAQHDPAVYNHIVPCGFIDDEPVPMECTLSRPLGWEPQYKRRGIVKL